MLQYFTNLFSSNKDQFYSILLKFLIKLKVNVMIHY